MPETKTTTPTAEEVAAAVVPHIPTAPESLSKAERYKLRDFKTALVERLHQGDFVGFVDELFPEPVDPEEEAQRAESEKSQAAAHVAELVGKIPGLDDATKAALAAAIKGAAQAKK